MRAPQEERDREEHAETPREQASKTGDEQRAYEERGRPEREGPGDRQRRSYMQPMRRREQERPEEARRSRRRRVSRRVHERVAFRDGPRVLQIDEAVVEGQRELASRDEALGAKEPAEQ